MKSDQDLQTFRRWCALGLITLSVFSSGILLMIATDEGSSPWLMRIFLLIGAIVVGGYLFGIFLPFMRKAKERSSLIAQKEEQRRALMQALEEIRYFDLVRAAEPVRSLPPDLEHAVDAATHALGGLVQQIQGSSVEVATSAMTVKETSTNLASGSSEQAAAVVEITATMEELARTAAQIATNAASQSELASRAEKAGNEGAHSVESAVEGVEAVRLRMDAIADRADGLGRRSREIYRVLELINEIAQETHILSLNASIEASGAGEHGERFSVVADEVRRLAERSRESVESVRGLLEEFTDAIRSVIVATEEGSKAAGQVLEMSRATAQTIEHLSGALADTTRKSKEISLATQEQQTASDQVVMTLKEVSEVIQRIAEGLKRFTGAAEKLNHTALNIQLLTQSFRIDSQHSLKNKVIEWAKRLGNFSSNLEAADGVLVELQRECPYLEFVYLVDIDGMMVAASVSEDLVTDADSQSKVVVGQLYSDRPWFTAIKRDQRTAVTPPYSSLLTGDQCFTIATAVNDLDGKHVGTFGVDVNARNWTRI